MNESDLKAILARNPAIRIDDSIGDMDTSLVHKINDAFIKDRRKVPTPEPERGTPDALDPMAKGETTSLGRPIVSIVFYRTRLVDPDGLNPKDLLDGLVKACLICDDSEKDIELIPPTQVKVAHKHEERTVIVINYI